MQSAINFGSSGDRIIKINNPNLGRDAVRHTTRFFRNDLNWSVLGDTILDSFSSKIPDIHVGACSDGSEVCSLKMLLEKKAPEKEFKIHAFDISNDIVAKAQKGAISIWSETARCSDCLKECIKNVGKEIFDKNLQKIPGSDFAINPFLRGFDGAEYNMTEHLTKNIKFAVGDAVEFSKQKFQEPIVFMFRNVWPYLKNSAREELAQNLAENLPRKSLVAIGDYDDATETRKLFGLKHFAAVRGGNCNIFQHL